MKVVVNRCEGGFNLSPLAVKRYLELKGYPCYIYKQTKYAFEGSKPEYERITIGEVTNNSVYYSIEDLGSVVNEFPEKTVLKIQKIQRNDKALVQAVEELWSTASGKHSQLEVIEIPDDIEWEIENKNGYEIIHEKHRSW